MDRHTVVTKATSYMRKLARDRSTHIVTADDVQNFLNRNAYSNNVNERMSVVRSVLSEANQFRIAGTTQSTRQPARGRRIAAWTLV